MVTLLEPAIFKAPDYENDDADDEYKCQGIRQTARGRGIEAPRSTEAAPADVHRALVLLTR